MDTNVEFPSDCNPSVDSPTASSPSTPTAGPSAEYFGTDMADRSQQSTPRPRLRDIPSTTTARLRIAFRSLGLPSQFDMTLEDVQRDKDFFLSALAGILHPVLKSAYESKLADRLCHGHRIALSMAEIESSKSHRILLESVRVQRERDAAANEEQINILERLLGIDRLSAADMTLEENVQQAVRVDGLAELGTVDEEVECPAEAIQFPGVRAFQYDSDDDSDDTA